MKMLLFAMLLPAVVFSQVPDLGFWQGTPNEVPGCKTWRVRIESSLIVNLQVPIKITSCFGDEETLIFYPSSTAAILRDVCSVGAPTSTSDLVSSISETIYDCDGTAVGLPCNEESQASGQNEFPAEFLVEVGNTLGNVEIDFTFGDVPDKMIVEKMDGTVLINTGWRGSTSWQAQLNQGLADLGLPPETITSPGSGTVSFNKNFADSKVRVKIFTSYFLGSSSWWVTVKCPQ